MKSNILFEAMLNYRDASEALEAAEDDIARVKTLAQATMDATVAVASRDWRISFLRQTAESARAEVERLTLQSYDVSGEKTAIDQNGYKAQVAIRQKPVVTDQTALLEAVRRMCLVQQLCKLNVTAFKKFVKGQEPGAILPGWEWQESQTVRITLPKAKPEAKEVEKP